MGSDDQTPSGEPAAGAAGEEPGGPDRRGVEGTYGPKDSAEQAKRWFEEQRAYGDEQPPDDGRSGAPGDAPAGQNEERDMAGEHDAEAVRAPADDEEFEDLTDEDLAGQEAPLRDEAPPERVETDQRPEDAEDAPAPRAGGEEELPDLFSGTAPDEDGRPQADAEQDGDGRREAPEALGEGGMPAALPDIAHGGIDITSASTSSQAGERNVFLRSSDALTFVIRIAASDAIVRSGRRFDADYIVVRLRDNRVVRHIRRANMAFSWGRWFWISQGNNWNSSNYDTPARWGFENGIYVFRATVNVQGASAFATSADWVFRVR